MHHDVKMRKVTRMHRSGLLKERKNLRSLSSLEMDTAHWATRRALGGTGDASAMKSMLSSSRDMVDDVSDRAEGESRSDVDWSMSSVFLLFFLRCDAEPSDSELDISEKYQEGWQTHPHQRHTTASQLVGGLNETSPLASDDIAPESESICASNRSISLPCCSIWVAVHAAATLVIFKGGVNGLISAAFNILGEDSQHVHGITTLVECPCGCPAVRIASNQIKSVPAASLRRGGVASGASSRRQCAHAIKSVLFVLFVLFELERRLVLPGPSLQPPRWRRHP